MNFSVFGDDVRLSTTHRYRKFNSCILQRRTLRDRWLWDLWIFEILSKLIIISDIESKICYIETALLPKHLFETLILVKSKAHLTYALTTECLKISSPNESHWICIIKTCPLHKWINSIKNYQQWRWRCGQGGWKTNVRWISYKIFENDNFTGEKNSYRK